MQKNHLIILLLLVSLLPLASKAQYNKAYFERKGRYYLINDNFLEAVSTLNVLLQVDPDAYEGYFLRGIAKYNLHDLLGAESDFSKAVHYNPVFTTAYQYRGITRSRLGNFRDAVDDFTQAIELRPDISNGYYSRGLTFLMSGNASEAIDDLDEFIRREKYVASAYVYRGTAYLIEKDTLTAVKNFDKAIEINSYDPEAYNKRGEVSMAQKNYKNALEDFNMAIKQDTSYINSYFNRAVANASLKRFGSALSDFSKVIKIDSTSAITYFNRALLRSQLGDYNKALDDYNMVTMILPDNVLVYYNRALLLQKLGNIEGALTNVDRAIELYPDFANAYMLRSDLRFLNKDVKGADKDRDIAKRKIEEHQDRTDLSQGESIYSDTTYNFQRLLSFDFSVGGSDLFRLRSSGVSVALLPSFKFTFIEKGDKKLNLSKYFYQGKDDFINSLDHKSLTLSTEASSISVDSLIVIDKAFEQKILNGDPSWQAYFLRGTTQALVRQYTASINSYTQAIEKNPSNGFLYLNRSTVRSEMIDFISSLDVDIEKVVVGKDPNSLIKRGQNRQYNYTDAIADLNKAIMLLPDFAYLYYNRANLYAISGDLTAAYNDYSRAIELYPSFAEAYFNRGLVQIYLKDNLKGKLDLSKAAELGVKDAYSVIKIYSK